jgi:hypothetical protein
MTGLDFSSAVWRKSSRSNESGGDCVEVAKLSGTVGIRDSKHPASGNLAVTARAFSRFVTGIKTR